MTAFQARRALLPEGWASDVRIEVDAGGWITAVEKGGKGGEALPGVVVPGVPNLHSHAFQRAIAGATERRSPSGGDSFWSWREQMYRLCALFGPEDAEAVAAQLYAEMLSWGFTSVAEFHYLHHDPDGRPYADIAEMAKRHLAAARATGIGMTVLPCLYRYGGIFGREPNHGQRRFLNDLDGYWKIVEGCRGAIAGDDNAALGVAPHSLRAASAEMIAALSGFEGVIHIHAAEQVKEVEECVTATGRRPVEWLLENAPIDARWVLIHATHMTQAEIAGLARTGAVAGLCPTTEASLGDGIFALPEWRAAGGVLGVGTDSHVGTSPRDEFRQLETSQRLKLLGRAVATDEAMPHPGRALLEMALKGGAQASGRKLGAIAPGMRADFVAVDDLHPALIGRKDDELLDAWVFNGQSNPVSTVVVGGKRVVEGGRHIRAEAIEARFRKVMQRLFA
ncbi:formimidoylglutamate deiminase [Acetobacteraceae bacterium H6797]|nr:formimidoylglutamate deiminase [Acetobacteraceae bacterium H6797]